MDADNQPDILTRCFYQVFGSHASFFERFIYDCPNCMHDEGNGTCKYYFPIRIHAFNVSEKVE